MRAKSWKIDCAVFFGGLPGIYFHPNHKKTINSNMNIHLQVEFDKQFDEEWITKIN